MTKTNMLSTDALIAIAQSYGLVAIEQTGNVRIQHSAASKTDLACQRLYIAKQKKVCTRVDIAGRYFTPATGVPGLRVLSESEKFCKVTAQIDWSTPFGLLGFHATCAQLAGSGVAKMTDKELTKKLQEARKEAEVRVKAMLEAKREAGTQEAREEATKVA